MAETTLYYGRAGPDNETITADGPIKEDLHLMVSRRQLVQQQEFKSAQVFHQNIRIVLGIRGGGGAFPPLYVQAKCFNYSLCNYPVNVPTLVKKKRPFALI